MSEPADDAPVFKKPASRPKGNIRKREREVVKEDDDDQPKPEASSEGAYDTSTTLELMRELQKQRQRAKGVTLAAKGMLDEVDEALASEKADAAAAADSGLDSTFTSQTDSGEIDHNMLKYIEEQMQGGGGAGSSGEGGQKRQLNAEEADLYTTPSHLIGVVPGGAEADSTEDSANRWLAGIMEVPLGTEEKIATIEQTEEAKRLMMEKQRAKKEFQQRDRSSEHQMKVPGNFNANFHQHRRENAMEKKLQSGGRPSAPHGAGKGGPSGTASDSAAFGRFKSHERRMGR